jgi:hypothetical protein
MWLLFLTFSLSITCFTLFLDMLLIIYIKTHKLY